MEYATPVKLPDGRYFLKITASGGARVLHQVNGVKNQEPLVSKTINLTIPEGSISKFLEVDSEIVEKAKTSKQEWFGKELSDETLQSAFQESVSDGVIQASLATVKGQIVATAYDLKKEVVELQDVKEGATLDVLFELAGIWFLKKSFGPIWRIVQVRIRGEPKSRSFPKEYLFNDSPEEEVEDDDPADYVD
jgi:hypothetical protein